MKIRTGFVSNSSSSSFICEVSGEVYSGYDAGLSDFDLMECTNGHVFSEDYVVGDPYSRETLEKMLIDGIYNNARYTIKTKYNLKWNDKLSHEQEQEVEKEAEKEILELKENDEWEDRLDSCYSEVRYSIPPECCPICSLGHISDETVRKYLIHKFSASLEEVKKEIKEKYRTLQDLNNECV